MRSRCLYILVRVSRVRLRKSGGWVAVYGVGILALSLEDGLGRVGPLGRSSDILLVELAARSGSGDVLVTMTVAMSLADSVGRQGGEGIVGPVGMLAVVSLAESAAELCSKDVMEVRAWAACSCLLAALFLRTRGI